MNYYFTIPMILFIVSILMSFAIGVVKQNYNLTIIGSIGMFILIISVPFNIESFCSLSKEVRPAISMRTFDAISLKAADWPEVITTDVNCLDKPVQIVKTVKANIWGLNKEDKYTYEIVPVENSSK